MRVGATRLALVAIDAFAAVSAIGGGFALLSGLEGDRFPTAWLTGTPFSSYMVPGLLLALVVGGSAAVATAATLARPEGGAPASMAAGLILVGWIVGELLLLNQPTRPSWTEVLYACVGVLMIGLGLALGQTERRKKDA
jgi:hypothetical protein